jgi:hypothetical protein
MMKLRAVTNFFAHQPANNLRPDYKGDHKAGQYRRYRAKDHVLVGVKAEPVSKNLSQIP